MRAVRRSRRPLAVPWHDHMVRGEIADLPNQLGHFRGVRDQQSLATQQFVHTGRAASFFQPSPMRRLRLPRCSTASVLTFVLEGSMHHNIWYRRFMTERGASST